MKTLLCAFFLVWGTAAFGQAAGALSAEQVMLTLPSHPHHADYTALGTEQSLSEKSTYTIAKGERPLWEVSLPAHYEVPLGDIARAFREEHAKAPKAEIVKEN